MSAILSPSGVNPFHGQGPELRTPGGKPGTGLVLVVALHVALGYALASGLAKQAIEVVKKPLEAAVIFDLPPPKPEKIKDIVKTQTPPPPAYVPPPEVAVNPPPAPTITQTQAEPPKAPVEIAPPTPVAPPAPAPKPEVQKQDITLACPGYQATLAQALEDAFERVGIPGTVRTLIKLRGNQITEVLPQSGPQSYYKYLTPAIKRIKCAATGTEEVHVLLNVDFKK
ncbi:hypothetical protein ACG0Z6_06460 [Roseateles sp. BYS180W]|uniref:Energy transducer TonB n=1 Tax=Roseateles rivi TaxID=3299028 RepID=A0ABW7FUC0_9BURK